MPMRIPTRVYFEKKGRLKYLAHLDTMRAFMRAITRAGLPVWYTQGYNPQIYLSFSLPLSLGYEGLGESFDIYLLEDRTSKEIVESLNQYLPEGMKTLDAGEPILKATEITWADYRLEMYYDAPLAETKDALEEYFSGEKMMVDKKTKRRTIPVDLKQHIKTPRVTVNDDHVDVFFRVAAGNQFNINPRLFTEGFSKKYQQEPKHVAYTRVALLDSEENPFR